MHSSSHPDPDTAYPDSNPVFDWSAIDAHLQGSVGLGSSNGWCVSIADGLAYVGSYSPAQIAVVDVADPASPSLIGHVDNNDAVEALEAMGGRLYAGAGGGLYIYDPHDKALPTLAGSCQIPYAVVSGLAVDGDRVYVAGNGAGLSVVDVTAPANPLFLKSVPTMGDAREVVVRADRLYVISYWGYSDNKKGGLQVFDIGGAHRDDPLLLGGIELEPVVMGLDVQGDYAYATGYTSLRIVNIADPADPQLVSVWQDPTSYPWRVKVLGDIAYVPDGYAGVRLIDVQDKAHPRCIAFCPTDDAAALALSGGCAYVANYADAAVPQSSLAVIQLDRPFASWWIDHEAAPTAVPGDASTGRAISASFSGLAEGQWYFHVQVKDDAGNAGPITTRGVKIGAPPILQFAQTYTTTGLAPAGIAVDESGNVYAANDNASTVEKFDSAGGHLATVGSHGTANGQFMSPRGVTVYNHELYVSDVYYASPRIQVFSLSGVWQRTITGNWESGTWSPSVMTFDIAGNMLVLDVARKVVDKVGTDGTYLGSISISQTHSPVWMAMDQDGDLYISDDSGTFGSGTGRVCKFSSSGVLLRQWDLPASPYSWAAGIGVDSMRGSVYVVDQNGTVPSIDVFTLDGNQVAVFGGGEAGGTPFVAPFGLGVGPDGRVYVGDYSRGTVDAFTRVW